MNKSRQKKHYPAHQAAFIRNDDAEKGLNVDEVSELLGDTPDVARVYARILNEQIAGKIKTRPRIAGS